jgi:putative toxin-antitoxin system antitoxin component (TIGR02293 family)
MSAALKTRLPIVDRYWHLVEKQPRGEHLYVTLLGLRTFTTVDLRARVEEGLSFDALERLHTVLELSLLQVAELIRVSSRTLARRKESGRLQPDESDRLLRLSRLVGLALQLFEGDLAQTRAWLHTPHRSLGGVSPLDFATTDIGAREVEHLIGRLEHGAVL